MVITMCMRNTLCNIVLFGAFSFPSSFPTSSQPTKLSAWLSVDEFLAVFEVSEINDVLLDLL